MFSIVCSWTTDNGERLSDPVVLVAHGNVVKECPWLSCSTYSLLRSRVTPVGWSGQMLRSEAQPMTVLSQTDCRQFPRCIGLFTFLTLNMGLAAPIELSPQLINLPANASAPRFADVEGDGR